MSLITPKIKKPAPKSITFTTEFEVWLELLATGSPRETMEGILNDWFMKRQSEKESFFVTATDRIRSMNFGTLPEEEALIVLREKMARAEAMNQHQKAASIKNQIIELERDLLLIEKRRKENA